MLIFSDSDADSAVFLHDARASADGDTSDGSNESDQDRTDGAAAERCMRPTADSDAR